MQVSQPAFRPEAGKTVSIAASNASANVSLQAGNTSRHVRVYNSGTVIAFIAFGETNAVTASTSTDFPIEPGGDQIITAPYPWVAAITVSGTATVYFTPGEGV